MANSNNPAVQSLRAEQRAQRKEERKSSADQKLENALKDTFPASDPVAAQAAVTPGMPPEDHGNTDDYAVAPSLLRVTELERLIVEEVRARPLRALAWAAATGVLVGFWAKS